MRAREGEHVRADLDQRRTLVADLVERVAVAADEGRASMEQRLTERVAQLRVDLQADETAVAQEIVRTAARSDISEEVSRFRGHVAHWVTLADGPEPCGRKLDFLLQEMNREVNTMGSKADGLRVSELIIAAKAELEKMREQVQNVEYEAGAASCSSCPRLQGPARPRWSNGSSRSRPGSKCRAPTRRGALVRANRTA